MIYVSTLLIIFNIVFSIFFNIKINAENPYTIEKSDFYISKLKLLSNIVNLFYIIISIIYYLSIIIYSDSFDAITFIFFLIALGSYLSILLIKKKNRRRSRYIDDKLLSMFDYLMIISAFTLIVYGICSNSLINVLFFVVSLVVGIFILFYSFRKNRGIFCYKSRIEDYMEDIKFVKKIEYNKVINYIIYIMAYISFVYIRIPYIELFYIIVFFLLLFVIYTKYKKIVNEQGRLYRAITISHVAPGIKYAFDFTRDLLFLKELFILLIIYIISITSLYGLGERAFMAVSVILYLLLLYVRIANRVYLIRYISSLNDEFIDKKKYSINDKKQISFIDVITILKIKLYRLIIVDNNIYKSNLFILNSK